MNQPCSWCFDFGCGGTFFGPWERKEGAGTADVLCIYPVEDEIFDGWYSGWDPRISATEVTYLVTAGYICI